MDVCIDDEAVVSDSYTPLRVSRFGLPAELFSFCQIFKVAHHPTSSLVLLAAIRLSCG